MRVTILNETQRRRIDSEETALKFLLDFFKKNGEKPLTTPFRYGYNKWDRLQRKRGQSATYNAYAFYYAVTEPDGSTLVSSVRVDDKDGIKVTPSVGLTIRIKQITSQDKDGNNVKGTLVSDDHNTHRIPDASFYADPKLKSALDKILVDIIKSGRPLEGNEFWNKYEKPFNYRTKVWEAAIIEAVDQPQYRKYKDSYIQK